MAQPVGPKHAVGLGLGRIFWPDRSSRPGLGWQKQEFTEGLARRPDEFLARWAGLGQQKTELGFLSDWPDPARPEIMPRYRFNTILQRDDPTPVARAVTEAAWRANHDVSGGLNGVIVDCTMLVHGKGHQ
jgi:hypothetical protein